MAYIPIDAIVVTRDTDWYWANTVLMLTVFVKVNRYD